MLTLLGTAGVYYFHQVVPVDLPRPLTALPTQIGEQIGEPADVRVSPFRLTQADEEIVRLYRNASGEVFGLYVAYFRSQNTRKKLVDSQSRRLTDRAETLDVRCCAQSSSRISRTFLSRGGKHWSAYFWFDIDTHILANRYMAKLSILQEALWHGRTNGALVLVFNESTVADGPPKPSPSEAVFLPSLVRAVHNHLSHSS